MLKKLWRICTRDGAGGSDKLTLTLTWVMATVKPSVTTVSHNMLDGDDDDEEWTKASVALRPRSSRSWLSTPLMATTTTLSPSCRSTSTTTPAPPSLTCPSMSPNSPGCPGVPLSQHTPQDHQKAKALPSTAPTPPRWSLAPDTHTVRSPCSSLRLAHSLRVQVQTTLHPGPRNLPPRATLRILPPSVRSTHPFPQDIVRASCQTLSVFARKSALSLGENQTFTPYRIQIMSCQTSSRSMPVAARLSPQ